MVNPEILPPEEQSLVQVWRWHVTPRTATLVKFGAAIPALGGAGWLLQNFLQLRGIVNLLASRIDLGCLALCVFAAGYALTIGVRRKRAWRIIIGVLVFIAALTIDWLSPKPLIDNARLEIDKVITVPLSAKKSPYVFLNVTYNNLGKVVAVGFLSRASLVPVPAPHYMTKKEINDYRAKNSSTFTKNDLKYVLQDDKECYPNDPKVHYFSIPEKNGDVADIMTKEFDKVTAGNDVLYVFMTLLYRDHNMSSQVFGVTETCVYFVNNFDTVHECGNRSLLKSAKELTSDDPNGEPYH